jgi:Asp-tRNA(Asn)/Glu-tRNA(Gln) amidotransferase C subunit
MEKWQIEKINDLYSQLDKLKGENQILRHNAQLTQFNKRLETIEHKIDQLLSVDTSQAKRTPVKRKK